MEKQELQYGLMWWLNFKFNHISCCIYMVHGFKAFQNVYKYCAFIEWFTVVNEFIMITLCIYSVAVPSFSFFLSIISILVTVNWHITVILCFCMDMEY